jgi:hypothetical protein
MQVANVRIAASIRCTKAGEQLPVDPHAVA